ncbi:MAG TPA: peptidoglycan editing factor PgeF [Polyangiaceae bacterium]|jgi:hypothetical protein|nr:peptidoglycan editing factor PgeF [Polyangiaceae bacterium]
MNEDVTPNLAEFRTSPLLAGAGFRHAFFTRRGGVSTGPYASLNFSVKVGDSAPSVQANLERAAAALGVDASRTFFLSQVHGSEARVLGEGDQRRDVLFCEADALIGVDPASAVAVRIADCIPILVGDRASGAALAIHAGWRGVVAGVIERAVERLRQLVGGPGDLVAAIGPHITLPAFEVSDDVATTLLSCSPDPAVVDRSFGAKPHVDLGAIASAKLRQMGLSDSSVDRVPGCTVSEPAAFFSYRRDGARSGRHLAAIVPRG